MNERELLKELTDLLDGLEALSSGALTVPFPDMKRVGVKYRRQAKLLKAAAQVTESELARGLLAKVQGIEKVFGERRSTRKRGRPSGSTRKYASAERLCMGILVWSGQRPAAAARTVSALLRKRGNRKVTPNAIKVRWSKSKPDLSTLPPIAFPLRIGDLLALEELI